MPHVRYLEILDTLISKIFLKLFVWEFSELGGKELHFSQQILICRKAINTEVTQEKGQEENAEIPCHNMEKSNAS